MIPYMKPTYIYIYIVSLNYLFGAGQVIPVAHPLLKERQDDVVFVTMVAHVEDLPKGQAERWRCNALQLTSPNLFPRI